MFQKRKTRQNMADIHVYTAKRLSGMAGSLEELAKTFGEETISGKNLSKRDGMAAMQMAGAMVCGDCRRCNLYTGEDREGSYYLYYFLWAFEQKGSIQMEDMPQFFRETCRRKEEYVDRLNRNLGRAAMNLSWKNRFLESRDAVVSQFRELAVVLEEISRQIEDAQDVTEHWEGAVRRNFQKCGMELDSLLILEYENRKKEIFMTARMINGKCMTVRDAADHLSRAMGGRWAASRDSGNIITRQWTAIRFLEEGAYHIRCGAAGMAKQGQEISGDNYLISQEPPGHGVISLSDGMGSGEEAGKESRRVIELVEQLLIAGYSPRSSLKLVNTVLLLAGEEQHPATIDLCCIDLYAGVLEAMKLGAAATFIIGVSGVDVLQAGSVPAGILNPVEPALLSRKLWDGDRIVMVSDGILDALPGENKEKTMQEYLSDIEETDPQKLAEQILEFAASFGEHVKDDMTVVAAEVWK